MSELNNQVFIIKGKTEALRREIKNLSLRGKNSVNHIRSKLDLLNLDDNEDLTDLDLESADAEFKELKDTVEQLSEKKDKLKTLDKELKQLKNSLGD